MQGRKRGSQAEVQLLAKRHAAPSSEPSGPFCSVSHTKTSWPRQGGTFPPTPVGPWLRGQVTISQTHQALCVGRHRSPVARVSPQREKGGWHELQPGDRHIRKEGLSGSQAEPNPASTQDPEGGQGGVRLLSGTGAWRDTVTCWSVRGSLRKDRCAGC